MRKLPGFGVLVPVSALALVAAGCEGGGGDDGDDTMAADAAPTPDAPPDPPDASPADAAVAPEAPTGVTATPGAGGVTVAWTNPTAGDFAGVIVVRRAVQPVAGAPADGMDYAAPGVLGAGEAIVYSGTGTEVVDADAIPGTAHYAVFAKSAPLLWSPPGRASALAPVPPQLATLTVTLAGTPAVTVTKQPEHYTLGATVSYDDAGDAVTITLTTTSGFVRPLFSPKVVITAASQGALAPADGQLGGKAYRRLGLGLVPGAQVERALTFTGIDGAVDPVTIDVELLDHPILFSGVTYNLNGVGMAAVDTGTLSAIGPVPCDALSYTPPMGQTRNNSHCAYRAGALGADGARAWFGHRSLPVVRLVDTTTGATLMSADLAPGQVGSVDHVLVDPAGATVYASLAIGGHAYPAGTPKGTTDTTFAVILVKLDATTLAELGRVTLYSGDVRGIRGKRLALSPDGTKAAVAMYGQDVVRFVDTATMAEIDTDAGMDGVQPVQASANGVKQVLWTRSGAEVLAYYNTGTSITRIDATTYATDSVSVQALGGGVLTEGPDGRIWSARGDSNGTSSLMVLDLGTSMLTPVMTGALPSGAVVVSADNTRAYTQGFQDDIVAVIDVAAGAAIDVDGDADNGLTAIALGAVAGQHWLLLTPY